MKTFESIDRLRPMEAPDAEAKPLSREEVSHLSAVPYKERMQVVAALPCTTASRPGTWAGITAPTLSALDPSHVRTGRKSVHRLVRLRDLIATIVEMEKALPVTADGVRIRPGMTLWVPNLGHDPELPESKAAVPISVDMVGSSTVHASQGSAWADWPAGALYSNWDAAAAHVAASRERAQRKAPWNAISP